MFNTKKCLIRATVILLLMTTVSCGTASVNNVTINLDEVGASFAILKWEAVLDMTGYEIYSATSKDNEYTFMDSTTDLTYTDSTLIPLSVVYYKIRPYKETEGIKTYSPYSNSISAETTSLGSGELILFGLTSKEVILAWEAVPGASSYEIFVSTVGETTLTSVCVTELLTCTLPITASKTYFYRLKARYQSVGELYSGPVSAPLTVIANPIINPAVRLTASETSISGGWKIDTTVSGYEIYLGTSSVFVFAKKVQEVKTNAFTLKGLISGQGYTIWVKAYVNTATGRRYSEFSPVSASVLTIESGATSD